MTQNTNPTLYYYEHCPFCVRVRATAGLLGIELNKKILANDDVATPIAMIGAKMLPILEKVPLQEGVRGQFMGESLDIIDYLCETANKSLERNKEDLVAVNNFLTENRIAIYSLAMPRWIDLGFEEFATQNAIDFFVNKKTATIGDFDTAIKKTDEFVNTLHNSVKEYTDLFVKLTEKTNSLAAVLLFSGIWGATSAKKLQLSDEALLFMKVMSEKSGVELLTHKAI